MCHYCKDSKTAGRQCGAQHPGTALNCTRETGHPGDHVSCAVVCDAGGSGFMARWPAVARANIPRKRRRKSSP